jgi:hypothetical protein
MIDELFGQLLAFNDARRIVSAFLDGQYGVAKAKFGIRVGPVGPERHSGIPAFTVHGTTPELVVTEAFTNSQSATDPLGQFDLRLHVLLHELVHAWDHTSAVQISSTHSFRDAYATLSEGWQRECDQLLQQWRTDADRETWQAAWLKMRSRVALLTLSNQRQHHLPSAALCSSDGREEALAESVSLWILDRTAVRYFPDSLANWLRAMFAH